MATTFSHRSRAPSNIALIKYMGKTDPGLNLAANPSLSLTLSSLCSFAEVTPVAGSAHRFENAVPGGIPAGVHVEQPDLNQKGELRILKHVERVVAECPSILDSCGVGFRDPSALSLRCVNTFAAQTGIASSASSFAAVTLAVVAACARDLDRMGKNYENIKQAVGALSRKGSGSSIRSFEGPWVVWDGTHARQVKTQVAPLCDLVLLVSREPKRVGSSEAHARVVSSPLWSGRPNRARSRLNAMLAALAQSDLGLVSDIAWEEYWEMHSLFHTSQPGFSYWKPETLDVLLWLETERKLGAIVTMDAGPNVHLLVPQSERAHWQERVRKRFPRLEVLADNQGTGAHLGY